MLETFFGAWREETAERRLSRSRRQHDAILKVQRMIRRWQARTLVTRMKKVQRAHAAIRIQSAARGRLGRLRTRMLRHAAARAAKRKIVVRHGTTIITRGHSEVLAEANQERARKLSQHFAAQRSGTAALGALRRAGGGAKNSKAMPRSKSGVWERSPRTFLTYS